MTPEKLHEAIGLLPSDLVAETDQHRLQQPKPKFRLRHIAAMAACFAVILSCGIFLSSLGMGGSSKGTSTEMAAADAPAPSEPIPSMAMPERQLSDEAAAPAEGAGAEAEEAFSDPIAGNFSPEPTDSATACSITADLAVPAQFAVRLLRSSHVDGQNTLVSPLSVFSALAMTANGANGDTLSQMEDVLGMSAGDMGSWLGDYLSSQTGELKLANSIWFTDDDRLNVNPDFLSSSADTFQAEITRASMDPETCNAINRWVREKTDGMIPSILDKIPEDAVMYLVNALAFEADWNAPYEEYQVRDGIFKTEDGREQAMELMHSTEHVYYEDDYATGFRKSYDRGRYAFVALVPKEGVTVEDYLETLTGEHLQELLENPTSTTVYAALPKFEAEFETELSEILKAMGMRDAFDVLAADFSGIGSCKEGNLFISQVRHKTSLSVAEQGTRAGAATVVEMVAGGALIQDTKTVTLDRPFLYMIVDGWQNYPIFIGTMMDMQA